METNTPEHSPYQSPQENLIADTEMVGQIKIFSPNCRIGRLRYLAHGMLMAVAMYAAIGLGVGLIALVGEESAVLMGVLGLLGVVVYVAVIVYSVILMVQRLHDQDLSGWLWLLTWIPVANIVIAIMLLFVPGSAGVNRYGAPPPPNKVWHWISALIMPIAFIGILAAIAIPAYQDYLERAESSSSDGVFESFEPQSKPK